MSRLPPRIRPPTSEDIRRTAASFHLDLSDEEVAAMESSIEPLLESYQRLRERSLPEWNTDHPERTIHGRPTENEDPYNAIVNRCTIPGATRGPLSGYEIGIKDNIAMAGVEMTCGSNLFEGYVPERDATVVERLLDAGATITATLNMEDLAYSGSGELSAHGPVLNPRDDDHLAGGSSSGAAVATLTGAVDVALGTDQGGSCRIPASWCGVVGLKPSFGLVPYTGVASRDASIDHVGVLARTTEDVVPVLEAIAGEDPVDPRQGPVEPVRCADTLPVDPTELVVGVLEEGFGREESEDGVDATVRTALDEFAEAGTEVRSVSIPWHEDGAAVLMAIALEGSAAAVRDEGVGRYFRGWYDEQFGRAFGRARRENAEDLPPMQKLALVVGGYLAEDYQGQYYHRAQNLVRELAAAYDGALDGVDVLALPTTPHTAHRVDPEASLEAVMGRAFSMNRNTAPYDASGHPAVSVPCGLHDGLPVGLMLVGDLFDDAAVMAAADAFERSVIRWDQL